MLVLVLLPPLAGVLGGTPAIEGAAPLWRTIGQTLLGVTAFIALMLIAGRRALPLMLWQAARTGSRELFTLAVVASAIGIAYGAAHESLPLRDALSVPFFVSVGMLFEPAILVQEPVHVLGVVAIIMLGKALAALQLTVALRYPLNTALTVAASLA